MTASDWLQVVTLHFFPCAIRSLSLFLLDFDAHAWVKNCQVKKRLCASRAVLMICDVSADWMPSAANFVPLPFRNRLESAAVKLYSKGQLGTQARWTSSEINWIKFGACACCESDKIKLKNKVSVRQKKSRLVKKRISAQVCQLSICERLQGLLRELQPLHVHQLATLDLIWSDHTFLQGLQVDACCLWRVPGTVQSTHPNWKTLFTLISVFYFTGTMLLLLLAPVAWPKCLWNLNVEWPSKRRFSCKSKSFEDGKHVGISLGSQVSTFSVLWSFYKVYLWSGSAKSSWLD